MKKTDNMIFIWDFFKAKGLPDFGIAGLMGNLYAESGLRSNTLERLCIKRYAELGINFTDELYTISVDNGAISKAEFLSPMGKHYGYGLAQWTTESRKRGLYEYTERQYTSIGDLQAQCEYLFSELSTTFQNILTVLKTAQDINSASDRVLLRFEAPKDAEKQIELRRSYSNEIYKLMREVKMKAVERLLNEAITWEGYCEKKNASNLGDNTPEGKIVNAGSNNYTIFGKHLLDTTGASDVYGINYQWCDQFVDDMMVRTFGVKMAKLLLGGWSAYTPTSASYYKKMGQWYSKPKAGDQIFFRNSERIHHTGLVLEVGSNYVKTIEGNTSAGKNVVSNGGKVAIKTYSLSDSAIAGYGRPNYGLVDGEVPDVTYPRWIKSGNDWYYRIAEGKNAHGWLDIKNADGKVRRYYFDDKGKMLTGWQQLDNNYWFFFHDTKGSSLEGAMYVSDKNGRQFIATF